MEETLALAQRLRAKVEETFRSNGSLTVSIGVANCPMHTEDAFELVESAEKSLYRAKREGKNQVVF